MRSVAILSGSDLETACTSDVDSCKLRLRFAEGTSIDRKGSRFTRSTRGRLGLTPASSRKIEVRHFG